MFAALLLVSSKLLTIRHHPHLLLISYLLLAAFPLQPAIPRRIAGCLSILNTSTVTATSPVSTGFGTIGPAYGLAAFPPCPDISDLSGLPSGRLPGSFNATSVPLSFPEPVSSSIHNYSLSVNPRKRTHSHTIPHANTPVIPHTPLPPRPTPILSHNCKGFSTSLLNKPSACQSSCPHNITLTIELFLDDPAKHTSIIPPLFLHYSLCIPSLFHLYSFFIPS